jgi:transcriptional regulator with PAS, ATPase and Fis domain
MVSMDTMPARQLTGDGPTLARLFVYPSTRPAHVVPLRGASLQVGRRDTNDVVLDDSRASGDHVRLRRRRDTGRWHLEDLGSTNGTYVDGVRVAEAVIESSTVFRVGDTLMVMEIGPRIDDDVASHSIDEVMLERDVARLQRSEAPLLILGATGSGKGHLAQRIASGSSRGTPWIHVNCAALPRDLVEAELFGYERGAFTGAAAAKAGLIEVADGGTLFLDEIGELPPELQAKLLTTLEDGQVRRVGATAPRHVDVRVLAATNLDIERAIEDGTFRQDLYFRLAAHTLRLPPLRQRRPDIVRLFCEHAGLPDHTPLTPEALEALLIHAWPGNVRELLNVAHTVGEEQHASIDYPNLPDTMTRFLRERALALHGQPKLSALSRDPYAGHDRDERPTAPAGPSPLAAKRAPSKQELIRQLEDCDGNVSALARQLGQHRNQVVRWLDAYGIRKR